MTEEQIILLLQKMSAPQHRFMANVLGGTAASFGRGYWQVIDALVTKGLMVCVTNRAGKLVYQPPAMVRHLWLRMYGEEYLG